MSKKSGLFLVVFCMSILWTTPLYATTTSNPLLPLREVGESLGYSLKWDHATKTAFIYDQSSNYALLSPDDTTIYSSSSGYFVLDSSPQMINNTLFVPSSFWAKAFYLDVQVKDGNIIILRK